jgi:hypothetical protein
VFFWGVNLQLKKPSREEPTMKHLLLALIAASVALTTAYAIPPDQMVAIGSTATVTGAGQPIVFLCDSQEIEDRLMEFIGDGDKGAISELLRQHHLFPVADGAKVKIIGADPRL